MRIDVLYFEGCPNHKPAVERVRKVVSRLRVDAEVREVQVKQDDDLAALKFLGSPTVLVNGVDIDPAQRQAVVYGYGCRRFAGAGIPSEILIEQAIREAQGQSCDGKER